VNSLLGVEAVKVHVTKLAAAHRQLCAAIRMFFAGEDELAVHTVASASYRILADLKEDRGRDEVGDHYLTAIFYCVRDYHRGTLPAYIANNPATMNWIRNMAEKLPIKESTEYEEVKAFVSPDAARAYWQKRNKVSNFLKHADRDPKATIALDAVDNLDLLVQCLSSYSDLVNDDLGAEGLVLWLYFCVTVAGTDGLSKELQDMATHLEELGPSERLAFCAALVRKMNASSKEPSA